MPDKHKTESEVCECIKLSAIKSVLRIYIYFICYCVSVLTSMMKIFLTSLRECVYTDVRRSNMSVGESWFI